jgi:hypothetical protein
MLPPRMNRTAMNTIPNSMMSGGRVGVVKRGLVNLTLGLIIVLGHQGFNFSSSSGEFWRSAFKTIAECKIVLIEYSE